MSRYGVCLKFIPVPAFVLNNKSLVWMLRQLQGRRFQSIQLNKIPRTNWFAQKGDKQETVCSSITFSRQIFVLSSYQFHKVATFHFGLSGFRSFTIRLCRITSSKKRRRSRHLFYFTWGSWYISNSGSESKCNSQREKKLSSFLKISVRSCRDCTRRAVPALGLWAILWKLPTNQLQRWDIFYLRNLRIRSLLLLQVNSKKWRPLPDSKWNLVYGHGICW